MTIIIGDVHGGFNTLRKLVDKLPQDENICFVGDLIDRGPKSVEVVDFVIENGFDCVLGNHEELMIHAEKYLDREAAQIWHYNGGGVTLQNYDYDDEKIKEHLEWMLTLPLIMKYDEISLMVSHSSAAEYVNRGYKDEHTHFVLWDRPSFPKKIQGFYNVFGHTPRREPLIKDHFANIDTSMSLKHKLTALQYPQMKVYEQKWIEE